MRAALRKARPARQQIAGTVQYPAPVGGWNTRDALAAMAPTDAVALDNWYPSSTYCEIRGGHANHATGLTGNGKTLAVYNALNGTNKMFAATSSGIWDVSSAGAVGAAASVVTDGKFQWVNYGDGGTQYLIMVNGVDKARYYDGASWITVDNASTPALSNIATTELIHVNVFKERLFFIEKDTLSFWYLPAGAVGGALSEYPMESYFREGGYLMAMATWTIDGGSGIDDRAVFITSEGEVAVFDGFDPASATDWVLVGLYKLPRPLGRRCAVKAGGDVLLLTEGGAFPLSKALQSSVINYTSAISDKIAPTFTKSALQYGSNFGWQAIFYPAKNAVLVNIPVAEDGQHYQYVMNTVTGAWCRFDSWDAECWALFNGELYYCDSNAVQKAWTGTIDGADNIIAYGKQAFVNLGQPGVQKQVTLFRPILAVNGPIQFLTDIDIDYADNAITGTASYSVTSGAQWDVSNWDEGYWAAGLEVSKVWTSPDEYTGLVVSGKVKIATNSLTVQWMASDYMYQRGAGL